MAIKEYTEETFNRLAKAIMFKYLCSYENALSILNNFSLHLVCDETIRYSKSQQSAWLTAVNTGQRAFLGGVTVKMPPNIHCLLSWPSKNTLNEITATLGAKTKPPSNKSKNIQLLFGSSKNKLNSPGIRVISSGWLGGFAPEDAGLFSIERHGMWDLCCGSMRPTIGNRSMIIFKKVQSADELREGDIIKFSCNENRTLLHRIISINHNESGTFYLTQGDNNKIDDLKGFGCLPKLEDIKARVVGLLY